MAGLRGLQRAWTLTKSILSGIHVMNPGDLCADERPLLNLSALKHHELVSVSLLTGSEMEAPPANCHGAEAILAVPRSPELRVVNGADNCMLRHPGTSTSRRPGCHVRSGNRRAAPAMILADGSASGPNLQRPAPFRSTASPVVRALAAPAQTQAPTARGSSGLA